MSNKQIIVSELKDKNNNENNNSEDDDENKEFEEYENWADAPIEDSSDEEEEDLLNNLNKSKEEDNKDNNTVKDNEDKNKINNNEEKKDNINNEIKSNENNENNKEDIQKLVKSISLDNYHENKNKLKILLNNNASNQEIFIEFFYKYSLEQLTYQKIYSHLLKDIYSYLYNNKNNLKLFRKTIIEKCKKNLLNKKVCEENKNIINNNISLIAELIISKIIPKKSGIKCLEYLMNKFKKYSDLNKSKIKYMYLECVLLFLKVFCEHIYNYQKERIHDEFDEEIKKIINELNNIIKDEKNKDIPICTKGALLQLIEKAEKKWELLSCEKKYYESHFKVFNNDVNNIIEEKNEENNKSFNDSSFIKQDEFEKSFEEEEKKEENNNDNKNKNKLNINNYDDIEREFDKKANNKYFNKNQNNYNGKYNQNNIENWRQGDKFNNNNDYKNNNNNNNYYNKNNNYYNNSNNVNNNNNNFYKYNSNNSINSNNTNNNNNYYKYNSMSSNTSNNSTNNNYYYKYSNNSNNSGNNFKKYNNYNSKYSKNSNDNNSIYSNNSNSNNNNNNNNKNNTNNNTNNSNYNQNYKRNNYSIILSNLKQFRRHIDNNNNSSNFNWNDINNLIVNSKVDMNDFMEELIESCISFTINNDSFYYVDLYIKSIFNFYYQYFDKNDINDIKNVVIKHLKKLANNLNYDKNYYLEDIWVIIIYYLINNQILAVSDFNIFNREYNNIKNEIANVLKKVADYNYDMQNYLMKEIKNSKFYNDNKKIFE